MSVSLFSQDPAFSDLTPIPQQDAPNALVPIMYSLECPSSPSSSPTFPSAVP